MPSISVSLARELDVEDDRKKSSEPIVCPTHEIDERGDRKISTITLNSILDSDEENAVNVVA